MSGTSKVRAEMMALAALAVTQACSGSPPSKIPADTERAELARVINRVMALPEIHTENGLTARVLVPPGRMYDPLFMVDRRDSVWINDDGGQEGHRGSQILAIDGQGRLSTIVALGTVLPVTGFDIAPKSFAPYVDQIFSVAFPDVGLRGALQSNVIQRIEPGAKGVETKSAVVCTLPSLGTDSKGIPTAAVDARFGPEGSPFAGKFFSIAGLNYTVYQTTPDGRCTPFVTLDKEKWGIPQGLTFSPDGEHMLVSAYTPSEGSIVRIRPDGIVEPEPLARSQQLRMPAGLAYAPDSFGKDAGELFVAVFGIEGYAIEKTHAPPAEGKVYRLTPEGELKVAVSGLHTPQGIHFVGQRLLVSDVNGDFIAGGRELPDGFVVEITPTL